MSLFSYPNDAEEHYLSLGAIFLKTWQIQAQIFSVRCIFCCLLAAKCSSLFYIGPKCVCLLFGAFFFLDLSLKYHSFETATMWNYHVTCNTQILLQVTLLPRVFMNKMKDTNSVTLFMFFHFA